MKIELILLIVISMLPLSFIQSQDPCLTEVDFDIAMKSELLLNNNSSIGVDKNYGGEIPMIRLAIHNVKKTDGTGGVLLSEIDNLINMLPLVFESHGICFSLIYQGEIKNSYYYNMGNNTSIHEELTTNLDYRINGAINIYFIKPYTNGRASGPVLGGSTLFPTVVMGTQNSSGVSFMDNLGILAHELGHCLGLYHTHHFRVDDNQGYIIKEKIPRPNPVNPNNPNVNCYTEGDHLCDTPADPNMSNYIGNYVYNETECRYFANETYEGYTYEPDDRNIMSYAFIPCRKHFTTGQGERMRNFILNTNLYDDYVIRENVTLTGTLSSNRYYGTENSITSSIHHTSGEVLYQASNEVKLKKGFKITADANTSFHAKLGTYSCREPLVTNHGKITKGNNSPEISIKEDEFDFKMYPNPVNDVFTMDLNLTEAETINITITDLTGKTFLTCSY
jgi:hypothetical protein